MRLRMASLFFLIVGALAPTTVAAFEAKWVLVGGNHNFSKIYVDTQSIVRAGGIIRYWAKTEFQPATKDGWRQVITLEEADCAEGRERGLQLTIYYVDGTIDTTSSPSRWSYPVPGSVGKSQFDFACSKVRGD